MIRIGDCGAVGSSERLRVQIAEVEKREKRLKEVFNAQVVSFREAVFFLFGYRVDMASKATSAAKAASAPTTFVLTPQVRSAAASNCLIFIITKALPEWLLKLAPLHRGGAAERHARNWHDPFLRCLFLMLRMRGRTHLRMIFRRGEMRRPS